jgi:hypothetical protein
VRDVSRHLRDVAGDTASIGPEQARELHAPGVLPQMLVDRVQQPLVVQQGKHIELCHDHLIGSRRQIIVGLPVDEAEQRDDGHGKCRGQRQGQPKRRSTNEIGADHSVPQAGVRRTNPAPRTL